MVPTPSLPYRLYGQPNSGIAKHCKVLPFIPLSALSGGRSVKPEPVMLSCGDKTAVAK